MYAPKILKIVRDAGHISLIDLCKKFDVNIKKLDTMGNVIVEDLVELIDADLMSFNIDEILKTVPDDEKTQIEPFIIEIRGNKFDNLYGLIRNRDPIVNRLSLSVTDRLRKIQNVLEISITELASLSSYYSIRVSPLFNRHDTRYKKDVFVLMPFLPEMRPVYEDHIKKVVENNSLSCGRADDLFSSGEIMQEIWSFIFNSRLVIADCTGRNPNVFYEMGIAHVLGKTVILITQNETDIPFDIGHRRYIKYNYTPRGMQEFEDSLAKSFLEEKL